MIDHHLSLQADELFDGEVELDESYFGGVRKGKRGREAAGKTAVFGILKRTPPAITAINTPQTMHIFLGEVCAFAHIITPYAYFIRNSIYELYCSRS